MVSFYDEYEFLMRRMKAPLYAKKTTFATAYTQVKINKAKEGVFIRLSSGKGKYIYYNFLCSLSNDIVLLYYFVRFVRQV